MRYKDYYIENYGQGAWDKLLAKERARKKKMPAEMKSAQNKRWYEKHKDDPEFKKRRSEYRKTYFAKKDLQSKGLQTRTY